MRKLAIGILLALGLLIMLLAWAQPASAAGLEVTLTGTPQGIMAGDVTTYVATVRNTLPNEPDVIIPNMATLTYDGGSVDSNVVNITRATGYTGVAIKGNIPAGTSFVAGSVSKDGAALAVTVNGNSFDVPIGDMAGGAQSVIEYKVMAN